MTTPPRDVRVGDWVVVRNKEWDFFACFNVEIFTRSVVIARPGTKWAQAYDRKHILFVGDRESCEQLTSELLYCRGYLHQYRKEADEKYRNLLVTRIKGAAT